LKTITLFLRLSHSENLYEEINLYIIHFFFPFAIFSSTLNFTIFLTSSPGIGWSMVSAQL
jgi:hypothetical protein